ncbi:MAG: HAMP domain-containing protein [Gammaproteobacteria bacterium]|nr:HAMP domain-containing protein [Gammaproteobacteria bacterium]
MSNKLIVRLLNYFLLIAIAAIMIGVEFFFEMNRPDLKNEICNISVQQTIVDKNQTEPTRSPTTITDLRNKIVVMFGVLTLVVAIVMVMFIKNITMPLQKMANVAQSINEGDLSQIVPIEHMDEIGVVGNAINELTSNLQEITTFTCSTATEARTGLDAIAEKIAQNNMPDKLELEAIRENLQTLIEFADSFTLLHTDINNDS